jgi:hypothetical protein
MLVQISPLGMFLYALSSMHIGHDQEWLDFNINGPAELVGSSVILNLFPRWMLPSVHNLDVRLSLLIRFGYASIIGPLIGPANRRLRKGVKMARPLIEERLSMDPSQWPVSLLDAISMNF